MVYTLGHRGKPWNASLEPIWFIMMTFTKKKTKQTDHNETCIAHNEKYSNPETDRQVNSESF